MSSCCLFIDIETIPSQSESVKELIKSNLRPPGNLSKPESIEKWFKDNAETAAHEQWLKTALNGAMGEIVCASYAFGEDAVRSVYRESLDMPESELLSDLCRDMEDYAGGPLPPVKLVGHNVINFDARFLYQRSVIHSLPPAFNIPTDTRYNNDRIFDTMLAWAGWGNYAKLSDICAVLGIECKQNGIDGSKVWEYVQSGKIKEVADYCNDDVESVRAVYRRLTFSEGGL